MLLVEVTRRNTTTNATDVYRATDGRGYNHATAPGYYVGRVMKPPSMRRSAFSPGQAGGVVSVNQGSLVLADRDDALAGWQGYAVDGQNLKLLYLADTTTAYSSATTVLSCTMAGMVPRGDALEIAIRDRLKTLDAVQLQTALYAGSNTPPYGLEGDATLQGRPKPYSLGRFWSAPLTSHQANRSLGIFMVSSTQVTVTTLMVMGVPITAGTTRASLALLLSTTPTVGTWDYYAGTEGTWVRIAATNVGGAITAHGYYGAAVANRTAAQLIKAMAIGPGGFASADVYAADVTALDTALPLECCHWTDQASSVLQAINAIAASAGIAVYLDRLDRLRMKLLTDPSAGTSTQTFRMARGISPQGTAYDGALSTGQLDLMSLEPAPLPADQLLPNYRLDLGHTPVAAVLVDADLAGDRTIAADPVGGTAMRDFLALPMRTTPSIDSTVLDDHPLSTPLAVSSLFNFGTLSTAAKVVAVIPNALGSSYASAPTATAGAPGAGCTIVPRINGITSYTVGAGGSGYLGVAPIVTVTSASGTRAAAIAVVVAGVVVAVQVVDPGYGYTAATVSFSHATGTGATATAVIGSGQVTSYDVTAGGTGFVTVPTITVDSTGTGGSGATATAQIALLSITIDTTAALAEAARQRALRGTARRWFTGQAWLSPDLVGAVELMDCVTLDWPRFALAGGVKAIVLGDALGARNDSDGVPVSVAALDFWI